MPEFHLFYVFFVVIKKTNLPVFKYQESSVRRRFSDFEWLKNELERGSKVSLNFVLIIKKLKYSIIFRLLYQFYHQKNGKDNYRFVMMMEYLKMSLLKTEEKDWSNLLISMQFFFNENYYLIPNFYFNSRVACHPLAQNERCLHMFLQDEQIDKNYVPGKIRNT